MISINKNILYVSDLDGTLLHSDEKTSDYTNNIINTLVEKGMCFSYATARSFTTASKVASGLTTNFPVIVHNGVFIIDNKSRECLYSNYFEKKDLEIIRTSLQEHSISPIVYSHIVGSEKFSYKREKMTAGLKTFVDSRKGDVRDNPLTPNQNLFEGDVFYFTCIDSEEKLLLVYEQLKEHYSCVYSKDIYSGDMWLEIMPKPATKANAILQLKTILNCDKIIAFGDGINDISMFKIADECYAVENAANELKIMATAIISSNNEDGVAKWLSQNVK